ncbi:hypothetical protein PROFUN_05354 [Planoprotostelium fungivorum]|uniref:Uncharacterized protein n=1 Tax=Planoprotostelium fungivorum TaxID=1890364 RepID=A0A2P6NR56_9EUKA|nr:hypothetical protein PROFUN_05354 [Planoprotostelium fungivorum]
MTFRVVLEPEVCQTTHRIQTMSETSTPNGRVRSNSTAGTLSVTILEATNLSIPPSLSLRSENDRGAKVVSSQRIIGHTNARAVVSIGKKKASTKPKPDTLSPIWNEGPFIFLDVILEDVLCIDVRHKVNLGSGYSFGDANVQIATCCNGELKKVPIFLKGNQTGEITLKCEFDHAVQHTGILAEEPSQSTQTNLGTINTHTTTIVHNHGGIVSASLKGHESTSLLRRTTTSEESKLEATRSMDSTSSDISLGSEGRDSKDLQATRSEESKGRTRSLIRSLRQDRYNNKNTSFKKLFQIPPEDNLNYDVSAALHKHMLHHGRMYLSEHHLCFYSKVFGIRIIEKIDVNDIVAIEKESVNLVNPGITVKTKETEFHFASFLSRERTYQRLLSFWKPSNHPPQMTSDGKFIVMSEGDQSEEEEILIENSMINTMVFEQEEKALDDELTIELSSNDDKQLIQANNMDVIHSEDLACTPLQFFRYFYADESNFVTTYHNARGDKELVVEPWSSHPEYGKYRTLNYIAPVKAAIGPSQTRCEEAQRAYISKERITVEIVSKFYDIPYGDYFRVESIHQVLPVGEDKCKLTMSTQVNFVKRTFFEGKIKNGTITEMGNSCRTWCQLAHAEISKKKTTEAKAVKGEGKVAKVTTSPAQIIATPPPVAVVTPPPAPVVVVEKTLSPSVMDNLPQVQFILFGILVLFLFIVMIQISFLSSRMSYLEEKIEFLNRALLMAQIQQNHDRM